MGQAEDGGRGLAKSMHCSIQHTTCCVDIGSDFVGGSRNAHRRRADQSRTIAPKMGAISVGEAIRGGDFNDSPVGGTEKPDGCSFRDGGKIRLAFETAGIEFLAAPHVGVCLRSVD